MILKALYDYYQKHSDLPRPGFEENEFKYLIVIREDGSFVRLESLIVDAKKKTGQFFFVPKREKRTSSNACKKTFLLWDHYGYVLGHPKSGKNASEQEKNAVMAKRQHQTFLEMLESLPDDLQRSRGVQAVLSFYRNKQENSVFQTAEWSDCAKIPNCNLTFRLADQELPIPCSAEVKAYVASRILNPADETAPEGCCLVTGKRGSLCRLMSATPVPGGKANASLVAFQTNSGYDSYGREQCYNAPLSSEAEFACSTALKSLLSKTSRNKFSLADTTAVFWVEKAVGTVSLEALLPALAQQSKENAENNTAAMRKLCEAVYSGKLPAEDRAIRYYFLGLAPNAARICVRFWKNGTVGELAGNIAQHFRDLEISGGPQYPALDNLLKEVVRSGKIKDVQPNLQKRIFDAIFNGTDYPKVWMILCLQRICADGKVTSLRAAILKACVNRRTRTLKTHQNKEIPMNYDPENSNAAYQCGALFAVLEKTQKEANCNIKTTIRDRFFASASRCPLRVFSTLLTLHQSHLQKLPHDKADNLEKMIGEITMLIGDRFPGYLPPDEQGRFCLGYYQKRQSFFTTKENTTK